MRIWEIAKKKGFRVSDITGNNRKSELVAMRVYLAKLLNSEGLNEKQIGERLKKDRTTIIYYLCKYKPTEFYNKL